MALDPRTPVIVGVAQINQHPDSAIDAVEPLALMEQVLRQAGIDAGSQSLLGKLDAIAVVQGAWSYPDPARLLANALGADNARTILSNNGGNTPQSLVNHLAQRIQQGQLDSAAIVGAETIWSRRRQRKTDTVLPRTKQSDVEPDERFQSDIVMSTKFETERGMLAPINFYPLFESAIRANNGETLDQHRTRLGELWAGFNRVAVANPYGWNRSAMTASEIVTPSSSNRMVGFPYTKAMNSNWDLDQAAGQVMCSVQAATGAGIPRDRWVFPLAGTDAHDTYAVSERRDLHSSPAIGEAGKKLAELGGIELGQVAHIDLYSCFPSAVQVGATELGIELDRQLTVTGGLTFAGGPLNNYVSHSIATMVQLLREDAGAAGLVTANGGYLTKHALGLYSTEPGSSGHCFADVQEAVDAYPTTMLDASYAGPAVIEAYTVMHGRSGEGVRPTQALAALATADGCRTWAHSDNTDDLSLLLSEEGIGQAVSVDDEGVFSLR